MPTEIDSNKELVKVISGLARQVVELRMELQRTNDTLAKIANRLPEPEFEVNDKTVIVLSQPVAMAGMNKEELLRAPQE